MSPIEERIYVADIGIETRSAEDGGGIDFVGIGIVYNEPSRLLLSKEKGPFIEIIEPGAMVGCDTSEVLAVFNHDENQLLGANYSGTLRFEDTPEGVKVRIRKPDNTVGVNCAEWVRRGDIRGMSFKYTTLKDRWERRGGVLYRIVSKFKALLDLSLVTRAAFRQTTIGLDEATLRSFEAWEAVEARAADPEPDGVESQETPEPQPEPETPEVEVPPVINNESDQRSVGDELAWYKAKNKAHQNSLQLCL